MRVLVTGHKGFIGRNLHKFLIDESYEVIGYDKDDGDDLLDEKNLRTCIRSFRPDVISHLGAQAFLDDGEINPLKNANINILGTLNVLRFAKEFDAKVIVHSSGAVYGNAGTVRVHEDIECFPESHYGISKLCAEIYARFYHEKKELPTIITRFSSVYGPGRKHAPINIFSKKAVHGEPITIFGDGSITRDYTSIRDVMQGIRLIIDGKVPWGNTYNIASGKQTSVKNIFNIIEEIMGNKLDVIHKPQKVGDIIESYFDISKICRFGYEPTVELREGIREVIVYEMEMV